MCKKRNPITNALTRNIKDTPNNVKLTTEFIKVPGGEYGGSWAARVKGEPINPGTSIATLV